MATNGSEPQAGHPSLGSGAASQSASSSKAAWTPPPVLTSRSVLPDRYTDPKVLTDGSLDLLSKEMDPARMGMFICLLDERPHLHPSLQALHKHRLVAHKIPLPPDPTKDRPVLRTQIVPTAKSEGIGAAENSQSLEGAEWVSWRWSQEEESRRKAYLPLA